MKKDLQKKKKRATFLLKRRSGLKAAICLAGTFFSALFFFSGCQMEQQSFTASEQTENSSSTSEPMQEPLAVTAAGEAFLLLPDQEAACTATLPEALPHVEKDDFSVQVFEGETLAFSGTAAQLETFVPPQNGLYRYSFSNGNFSYTLMVETAFAPQIFWQESEALLGEALPLSVRYTDAQSVTAETSLSFQPVFYPVDDGWVSLLPIHWNTTPGEYPLTIYAGTSVFELTVTVADRTFEIQNLTVDETTTAQTVENDEANAEWNQIIEPLKAISDSEQYWSGCFLQPVEGEITTQYGMIRYVNGNPTSVRHSGVDLAADTGTPVQAAGKGRVLFAGYLQLTGNTVLIEHGYGLKSWYYHMDSLDVLTDQMVEQGQIIGKVGSTGFSTGPHLHFAMSVNRVFINPWTAIEKGFSWEE